MFHHENHVHRKGRRTTWHHLRVQYSVIILCHCSSYWVISPPKWLFRWDKIIIRPFFIDVLLNVSDHPKPLNPKCPWEEKCAKLYGKLYTCCNLFRNAVNITTNHKQSISHDWSWNQIPGSHGMWLAPWKAMMLSIGWQLDDSFLQIIWWWIHPVVAKTIKFGVEY